MAGPGKGQSQEPGHSYGRQQPKYLRLPLPSWVYWQRAGLETELGRLQPACTWDAGIPGNPLQFDASAPDQGDTEEWFRQRFLWSGTELKPDPTAGLPGPAGSTSPSPSHVSAVSWQLAGWF